MEASAAPIITALNTNHLHRYYEVIRTSAERLHRRLGDAGTWIRAEISHELTSYSLDITSALAFGYDLNTLEGGENELQEHIQRAFGMLVRRIAAPFHTGAGSSCRLTERWIARLRSCIVRLPGSSSRPEPG